MTTNMAYLIVAVNVIVIGVFVRGIDGQCNNETLANCTTNNLTSTLNVFSIYRVNSSNIGEHCKIFKDAYSCITTQAKCKDTDSPALDQWSVLWRRVDSHCGDGQADYLKYQNCISNNTYMDSMMMNCKSYNFSMTDNASPASTCSWYNDLLSCTEGAARDACGTNEAGAYARRMTKLMLDAKINARAPGCTGQCNATALDACLTPFFPVAKQFSDATINSTAMLDDACRMYDTANTCIQRNTMCNDDDPIIKSRWLGIKRSVGYTCTDGKQAYLKSQGCLSNETYKAEDRKCYPTMPSGGVPVIPTCDAIKAQINCVVNTSLSLCGREVSDYLSKIIPRSLAPATQARDPNCVIPGSVGGATAGVAKWLLNVYLLLASLSLLSLHYI